jgi:hypothetical protein
MLLSGTSTYTTELIRHMGLYTFQGVAELIPEVNSEDHAPLIHLHEIKTSSVLQVSQMASLATIFKGFDTIK